MQESASFNYFGSRYVDCSTDLIGPIAGHATGFGVSERARFSHITGSEKTRWPRAIVRLLGPCGNIGLFSIKRLSGP